MEAVAHQEWLEQQWCAYKRDVGDVRFDSNMVPNTLTDKEKL